MSAPTAERTDGTKIRYSDRGKYLSTYEPLSGTLVPHGVITNVCPVEVSDGRDNWSQTHAEVSLDTRKSIYVYADTQAFLLSVPKPPRPDLERLEAEVTKCRDDLISEVLETATKLLSSVSKNISPESPNSIESAERRIDAAAKALTKAATRYKEAK